MITPQQNEAFSEIGSVKAIGSCFGDMTEPGLASTAIAIEALLTSYHELNTSSVDELTEAPSPLAFMRYVAKNIPFVVRQGVSHWPAMLWNMEYLKEVMGDTAIEVAITPSGSVDARPLYQVHLI